MKKFITILSVTLMLLISVSFLGACDTKLKITYDSNGGSSCTAEKIDSGKSLSDIKISLSTPTKDGFVFDGWYIDNSTFKTEFKESTIINANITVYAKWIQVDTYNLVKVVLKVDASKEYLMSAYDNMSQADKERFQHGMGNYGKNVKLGTSTITFESKNNGGIASGNNAYTKTDKIITLTDTSLKQSIYIDSITLDGNILLITTTNRMPYGVAYITYTKI